MQSIQSHYDKVGPYILKGLRISNSKYNKLRILLSQSPKLLNQNNDVPKNYSIFKKKVQNTYN